MRIVHVVSTFPPYKGGMGNVAKEIAERATARGYGVAVMTPRTGIMNYELGIMDRDRSSDSVSIIHNSVFMRIGNAAWCPGIRRELERLQPDIVHLHWPFIGGAAPVFAWRCGDPYSANYSPIRTNKRIVERHRRLIVQYHMDLFASGWRGTAFAAYERWAVPRMVRVADRVVVTSLDYAKCGTLASYAKEIEGKVIEIPLGVDVGRFMPQGTPLPPSSPSPFHGEGGEGTNDPHKTKPLHVLFVGGLDRAHAFKGVPVLLEAVARVPRARLEVVGDGDLRPIYEQRARMLGISERVVFLGAVSDIDLPIAYRRADVLVLPSTARSEAFGVVLLEAMASGIATIASSHPGVRTVIVDGETGFLVPSGDVAELADRLDRLARDPEIARRIGVAGRHRAETAYAWDGIIERWGELYNACAFS